MGTLLPENLCAHRKGAIKDLIKGLARDTAAQLQILSEKPTGDHDGPEKLLEKRFTSFTESLSHVSLCICKDCEFEVTQIPNRVRSPISDQRSVNSGESCKRPAAEDRRGCYKRRKTSEMRMEVSTTNEDGHAWRKYGQTKNLEAQFPMLLEMGDTFSSHASLFHIGRSHPLNNPSQIPLLEARLRSTSSKTFSDSEPHSRHISLKTFSDSEPHSHNFPSITISTQYSSPCPSSAASVRKECGEESWEIARYYMDAYMGRSLGEESWEIACYITDASIGWSLEEKSLEIARYLTDCLQVRKRLEITEEEESLDGEEEEEEESPEITHYITDAYMGRSLGEESWEIACYITDASIGWSLEEKSLEIAHYLTDGFAGEEEEEESPEITHYITDAYMGRSLEE